MEAFLWLPAICGAPWGGGEPVSENGRGRATLVQLQGRDNEKQGEACPVTGRRADGLGDSSARWCNNWGRGRGRQPA